MTDTVVRVATPPTPDDGTVQRCLNCGEGVARVGGGQGPTWVHIGDLYRPCAPRRYVEATTNTRTVRALFGRYRNGNLDGKYMRLETVHGDEDVEALRDMWPAFTDLHTAVMVETTTTTVTPEAP